LQAEVHDHSGPAQPGCKTPNLCFPSAQKPGMLPSIVFALSHGAPFRPGRS
jgi:hypothetical protein